MKNYISDSVSRGSITYFLIRSNQTGKIVDLPTKYLKHKHNMHQSRKTIKKTALVLSWYLNYVEERGLTFEKVFTLSYSAQQEHFVGFLHWIKAGRHTESFSSTDNNTANSYLRIVFGFYEFIIIEYENFPDLKVLDDATVGYTTTAGIRFKKNVKSFKGYLPKKTTKASSISEADIKILINACTSKRNKLLLLLLMETGMRIGELLGVRYTTDIDYDNRKIFVRYRSDNENGALAKYAEERGLLMSPQTFTLLQIYLAENAEPLKDTDFLFVSECGVTKGQPLTESAVYSILDGLAKKTSLRSHPHAFRHYFANERRKAGWDTAMISRTLGHKNIATTEAYMNVEEEELTLATDDYYKQTTALIDIDDFL
ncbi:MAG: tyrosine-type recombinase/integrase [Lachnospiraceae bacterium]|nr:tyrosine-type recombinase/integrase [Lachnospiraceae bacterium]